LNPGRWSFSRKKRPSSPIPIETIEENPVNKNTNESSFPTFPSDIIQGVARKFVNLYSPIRETPEAFLWLSFVTYFGNAISPYVRLDCASSEPRFFGVVIGKSGRTRKSAGINVARDLFNRVGGSQKIVEGFGSAEGLLVRLGNNELPRPVVLHLDEINLIASKTDLNGSAGIAAFHKLFEDHDYDHPLAKVDYTVRNSYLSLIGASTLEDFTKAWSGKHEDAGFFSRLLLVEADTDRRIPRPVDPDADALAELVREVKELVSYVVNTPHQVLKMDKNAEGLWANFYNEFGDGPEWNRIDAYGFRLMAVQAVLRGEKSVTRENVQQVIDFLQYEVAVRAAVAPVVADNLLAKMEELIRRSLPVGRTLSRRELQRRTNSHRYGIDAFDRAIGNMQRNGEILRPERKSKTLLYTRADFDGEDDFPEGVGSSVIEVGDDTDNVLNPSKDAAFGGSSGNSLHVFVPEPWMNEERIM
jgi:hypothetical protein